MSLSIIIIFIVLLGALIFVHELGHFLLAKLCGVGVLEFAIGFGRQIFKKRIGETTYAVRWIPLGGFVKMVGEDPRLRADNFEAGDSPPGPEEPKLSPEEERLLNDRNCWFINKGYLAKVAIVLAGPLFNVIFAIVVSIGTYYYLGRPADKLPTHPVIGATMPKSPADLAGLQSRDLVKAINGAPIQKWSELSNIISGSDGSELKFSIERQLPDGTKQTLEIPVTPKKSKSEEQEIWEGREIEPSFKIGVQIYTPRQPVAGISEAVELGMQHVVDATHFMLLSLWGMVKGTVSTSNLGGPISIFQATAESHKRGIEYILGLIVLLNISLAVINLLPIPILDGGHLMFFTIEAFKGSPVSLRAIERANQVGMFLLLLLMVVAMRNDIVKLLNPSL